ASRCRPCIADIGFDSAVSPSPRGPRGDPGGTGTERREPIRPRDRSTGVTRTQEGKNVVFKRLLGSFGVGAPSVGTVVAGPRGRPGGVVRGEVRLQGGDFDAELESIVLALVTRADAEHGEGA